MRSRRIFPALIFERLCHESRIESTRLSWSAPSAEPGTIISAAGIVTVPRVVPAINSGMSKSIPAAHDEPDEHPAGPPAPADAGLGRGHPPDLDRGPAAWYLVPVKFKAQARLQVASQPPKVLFRTVETEDGHDDYKRYQNTQQTLVKSQLVLNAALQDTKVSSYRMVREQIDPIAWLHER